MCLQFAFEAMRVVLNVLSTNDPKVKVKSSHLVPQSPHPLAMPKTAGHWQLRQL